MANATTPVIQINEGNVGIGTTSPIVKLHVNGTNASVGTIGIPKNDWYTTAYNGIQVGDGTTLWGRAGDSHFSGNYYVKNNNGSAQDTYINALSAHDLWLDNSSGSLKYRNASLGSAGNAITFNTRFVVLNNGNFGIGVTSPNQKLHVNDGGVRVEKNATGLGGFITIGNATETAGNYSAYFFGNSPSDTNYFKGGIAYETLSATFGRGDMHFLQNDSSNATNATISDSVMTILNGGNVGIGVTSPDSVLHVSSSVGNTYSATINGSGASENMVGIRNTISSNVNDMVGIYFATGATNSGTHWSGITGSRTNHGVDWGTQLNFYTHDDDVANLTEATQKMVIKGSGKVGIGTTGPNDALEVRGDISTQHRIRLNNLGTGTSTLAFVKDTTFKSWVEYNNSTGNFDVWQYTNNPLRFATNNAERVRIDSLGLVGINVTSPQTRLQTNLGITGNYLGYLNGTASTFDMSANVAVVHNSPAIGNGTGAGLVLANNDKSDGAPSPIIAFSAKSASNSYNHAYAAIYGVRTASGADTNWTKGDIVLATGAGTGPNEIMRVTSAGNVGIGEVSPSSKLVVRKDNAGGRGGEISIVNYATTTVGNEAALNFGLEGSTYHADFGNAQIKARVMAANAASDMIFSTWNGSSFGERMRIEAGGNVGIGATNPANKLHVEGDTNGAVQIEVDNQNNGNASYAGLYLNGQGNNFFIKNWGDQVPTRTNSTEFISTASGSSFIFSTVSTERMTITSSGSTVLHDGIDFNVNAPTHRGSLILAGASAPTNFGGIEFHTNSGGGAGYGTKIYSSDATLGVATRNNSSSFTTRFEISGSTGNAYFTGNLGIGETSPDQKLNVREDGGGDVFRGIEVHNNNQSDARAGICFKAYDWVQSAIWHGRTGTAAYAGALVLGTNPNTTDLTVSGVTGRMYILNNGNVGIGDNSPDYRLAVKKVNAATPAIMVSGAHYGGPRIQTYGLDADANAWMGLGTDMSGAAYEHSIYFSDYNGNGRLTMGTYNGTTYSTKMVILRNGNVGIANTSPDKLLHVGDGLATLSAPQGAEIEGYNNTLDVKTNEGNNISDFTPAINLFCDGVTGSSGTGTGIYFRAKTGGGGGGEYTKGRIQGAVYTSWTTNTDATRTSKLVIQTTNSGTHADRVTILGNGDFGINDTSPSNKLDVNGDIRGTQYKLRGNVSNPTNTAATIYDQSGVGLTLSAHNVELRNYNGSSMVRSVFFTHNSATFTGTCTATNFILSSDKTLKENIKDIDKKHIDVNWKNFELKSEPGVKRAGVIAQELEAKHPEFVRTNEDGLKSVAYVDLLIAKIAELEARLEKAGL